MSARPCWRVFATPMGAPDANSRNRREGHARVGRCSLVWSPEIKSSELTAAISISVMNRRYARLWSNCGRILFITWRRLSMLTRVNRALSEPRRSKIWVRARSQELVRKSVPFCCMLVPTMYLMDASTDPIGKTTVRIRSAPMASRSGGENKTFRHWWRGTLSLDPHGSMVYGERVLWQLS